MPTRADFQRVQSLSQKKFRQKYGLFRAEGDKVVRELLEAGWTAERVWATEAWWAGPGAPWRDALGEAAHTVGPAALERLAGQRQPNGVVAEARMPDAPARWPAEGWVLALDRIRDPGNLGTLLRSADWFGAAVALGPDCADRFNPKVVQSAMGSLFRVPTRELDLAALLAEDPRPSFGAALDGEAAAGLEWPASGILLVGNEAQGLDAALRPARRVAIGGGPGSGRPGGAESLNAAVAAAVLLARATGAA
jgi:TrmH family RNA methyltransferase